MEWKQGFLMRKQMKHKQQSHGNVPMIQNAVILDFAIMVDVGRDRKKQKKLRGVPMIQNAVIPDFVLMANVSRDKYGLE
jgi:hypothetical protein